MNTLEKIEVLIKEMGWSKSEFLRRINLPNSTFTDWKAGRHKSYEKHLPEIAKTLLTTEDYLLGKTDKPRPDNWYNEKTNVKAGIDAKMRPTPFAVTANGETIPIDLNDPGMRRIIKTAQDLTPEERAEVANYMEYLKNRNSL